jgi:Na+-driven multidrug efflux pump
MVMALMGACIAALAETLTGWFGATGAETVGLATRFMWILALAQPLMAVEFSLGGALRGAGDTRFPLVSVMAGLFGGRLLLAYVVVNVIGGSVIMVWLCLLADWSIKATLLLWRFSGGTWKTIEV